MTKKEGEMSKCEAITWDKKTKSLTDNCNRNVRWMIKWSDGTYQDVCEKHLLAILKKASDKVSRIEFLGRR